MEGLAYAHRLARRSAAIIRQILVDDVLTEGSNRQIPVELEKQRALCGVQP